MPAISIAIDKVTSTGGILQNKNVTFKTLEQDSNRSELQAPLAAMSMFTEVQLFLGPVYGFGVAPIARYSRYWNVPIVTAGAAEVAFKDKEEFSVLTRVGAIYEESFKILKELNQKYDWTKFGLIYHRAGPQDYSDCYMTLWAAYEMLQIPFLDKSYPKSLSFNENNSSGIDAKKLLQELSSSTRRK
ncbi:atrial natriuretic peptide receptor 3-like [Watersipora subatra]|uniref:atrial natriuretic peptide receptor 3-like n=1 Tax=Watersipora subatra TaxID=2589382 RepID=UPI00355C9D54